MDVKRVMGIAAILPILCAPAALAEPTEIVVNVISKDAKFVGTGMGGAHVVLRDADTGEVLVEGLTAGGTGNTPNIMTVSHTRRDVLSDDTAAKFSATLDLEHPRKISASATGPMNPEDTAMMVSSTQWVVPGKHVNGGDAWLLELRGFAVSLSAPLPPDVALQGGTKTIPIEVKVTMMCGCPLEPGGMWDADKIEVAALVTHDGVAAPAIPLHYAGEASMFGGAIELTGPGAYVVEVYAYDPANGNTGVSRATLTAH